MAESEEFRSSLAEASEAVQAQARGVRVAAFDASNDRCATWSGVIPLDIKSCAFDIGLEQIGITYFLSRLLGTFIHALVANHVLQKVDGFVRQVLSGRHSGLS